MADCIEIDGPILVFGGCYSNLEATQALVARAALLGIPAERMICTGDVVAYCADAQATVDLVRNAGVLVIQGNCEESLGASAEDCGCGFAKGSACDALSVAWYAHADKTLDAGARAWMRELPRRIDVALNGRRLAVVHGSPRRINEFVFASKAGAELSALVAAADVEGVIAGHCGIPFTRIADGKAWHNSGAIGMPANDGTPRVWFSVIEPSAKGLRFRHRALEYDYRPAARKMEEAGLASGYSSALETGLWPSCDVLTATEVRLRGKPIAEQTILWAA